MKMMARKRAGDEGRPSGRTVAVVKTQIPSWTIVAEVMMVLNRDEEGTKEAQQTAQEMVRPIYSNSAQSSPNGSVRSACSLERTLNAILPPHR